ncbi:adenylate/guanylate cyclase domain-containing protein [Ahrensia sp. R2A130]|uniref:adenylate/guanylate cyclase domain-containing protein n=1 Tax=Ahrensia sp. R2A130 TaxID=744979 RepID=UPI0001E0A4BB|nr:adenylate/guanylate cyclase domain-containing protein [Ahrensia sp. R2A130]EFL88413.1 adenylate cyclase [Ahrensia sp. R2A130]
MSETRPQTTARNTASVAGLLAQPARHIWPREGKGGLPARVREAIAENEYVSEILVKAIQFIIFALWGLAWLASPKPEPDTVSQVPWIIGAYLVFTGILLLMAMRRTMPSALIYLSTVLDMVLLTMLIYSFHIQYMQPASFSLKTVEVMNFCVLIALRALRFEARYVIAAGAAAITCWTALVIYVVSTVPGDPMITRDYVTYLTSNSVLVGAEVSKIISMLMLTVILAIAVRRAKSFLVASVTEGEAAHDLSRFLPISVAEQVRDSEEPVEAGKGVRRQAAILNIDIRGFTARVANRPPAETVELLSGYQARIVPLVHNNGGVIDKYLGDGIMATFGASKANETQCADALRCIDAVLEDLPNWRAPQNELEVNLAVAAGPVIFGAVGDQDRLELTVIGPSVNLSAKLEKHNKELGTRALCSRNFYETALAQGYEAKREPVYIMSRMDDRTAEMEMVVLA